MPSENEPCFSGQYLLKSQHYRFDWSGQGLWERVTLTKWRRYLECNGVGRHFFDWRNEACHHWRQKILRWNLKPVSELYPLRLQRLTLKSKVPQRLPPEFVSGLISLHPLRWPNVLFAQTCPPYWHWNCVQGDSIKFTRVSKFLLWLVVLHSQTENADIEMYFYRWTADLW